MLKEYVLNGESFNFVEGELQKGGPLASYLADLPLRKGRVVTYLPDGVSEGKLRDLVTGGIANGEENAKVADLVTSRFDHSTAGSVLVVFEHTLARKGDPIMARWGFPYFTAEERVYLFADSSVSRGSLRGLIKEAHWYPAIGTCSSLPEDQGNPTPGAEVDDRLLRTLAGHATSLFVGAYDGEGWLVWTPGGTS